jgi:hypothetical protein
MSRRDAKIIMGLALPLVLVSGLAVAAERMSAEATIASWPDMPKQAAMKLIAKYGQPDGVTPDQLVWRGKGAWKETTLYREEIPHQFPMPHTDFLEQSIDYRVPTDKFDELAQYDGSVIVERTKGTLAARCDKEELNMLALNLAHDIITGQRSVEDARAFYAKTAMAFKNGEKPPYTQKLQFTVASGGRAGDPDKPAMTR